MQTVLIHLHPDFSEELESVYQKWNRVQDVLLFRGIIPPKEIEAKLMSGGAIPLEKTFEIAEQIRISGGHAQSDGIIIFTEKRIYKSPYFQLFFGGEGTVGTISLDFTRKLFGKSDSKQGYIFRALLNNILTALFQEAGFDSHEETLGCVLDFCNNMSDIVRGIEGGPRLCDRHLREVSRRDKAYLLALINAVANESEIAKLDTRVSDRITAFDQPVDVGIVIALEEEFRELFSLICGRAKPFFNEEISQYYYAFENVNDTPYRCVATFMGRMGPDTAALVGDRLIHQFQPATIVNIGVAGSMDKDVLVGDVVVANQVDNYLHTAKAIDGINSTFEFRLSGDPYKSSPDYVTHVQHFEYAHSESAKKWLNDCSNKQKSLLGNGDRLHLCNKGLLREHPRIHVGHIASGSIVGASSLFINWLRDNRDRKYLALEMESGGILNAAHTRAVATLVIRGISDYSDIAKAELDQVKGGALRRYAMINATLLLWALMDLQLLRRVPSIKR